MNTQLSNDQAKSNVDKIYFKRTLGPFDLILFGVGSIVGSGIFVMTGIAAARYSGPAIIISYIIAAIVCACVALCYCEVASIIRNSGSAYKYSHIVFGERVGWIIGWFLILEYTMDASGIASGWSEYIVSILNSAHVNLPISITQVPTKGGIIKLPAVILILLLTILLIKGSRESVIVNRILVITKMLVILLFVIVAYQNLDFGKNWKEFSPFGTSGIIKASSVIFFAYVGFDSISSLSQEVRRPKRDVTIGILGSLAISMFLYVLVAATLTALIPYYELDNAAPLVNALLLKNHNQAAAVIAVGAAAGLTSVVLSMLYGQSRILYIIASDGLLPKCLLKLHPSFGTPYISSIVVGAISMLFAGFMPIEIIADLISLGTLIAFFIVPVIVLVLRKRIPDAKRPFKCPFVYVVAPIAIVVSLVFIYSLIERNLLTFIIWSAIGVGIYSIYGRKHAIFRETGSIN